MLQNNINSISKGYWNKRKLGLFVHRIVILIANRNRTGKKRKLSLLVSWNNTNDYYNGTERRGNLVNHYHRIIKNNKTSITSKGDENIRKLDSSKVKMKLCKHSTKRKQ